MAEAPRPNWADSISPFSISSYISRYSCDFIYSERSHGDKRHSTYCVSSHGRVNYFLGGPEDHYIDMKHLMPALLIAILAFSDSTSQCPFCSASSSLDKMKAARLQVIQQEILDKLGLPYAPNVTKPHIPKIPPLLRLLDSAGLQDEPYHLDEDNYHARTERIIVFPEKAPELMNEYPKKCCFFTFRGKSDRLKISKAYLDVYVKRKSNATTTHAHHNAQIKLYKRTFPITEGIPERHLVVAKPLRPGTTGWYRFNVKRLVRGWRKKPLMNLGIDVEIEGADDSLDVVMQEEEEAKQPFLVIFTRDTGDRRRAKRNAGSMDCEAGSKEKRCCRFELVVDFQSFGWDWIIAPKRFRAFYCSGECQDVMLPMYPHAHLVNKIKGKPACCSPSKMSPISMLYIDLSQNIMHSKVPSMVAERCGCT